MDQIAAFLIGLVIGVTWTYFTMVKPRQEAIEKWAAWGEVTLEFVERLVGVAEEKVQQCSVCDEPLDRESMWWTAKGTDRVCNHCWGLDVNDGPFLEMTEEEATKYAEGLKFRGH